MQQYIEEASPILEGPDIFSISILRPKQALWYIVGDLPERAVNARRGE